MDLNKLPLGAKLVAGLGILEFLLILIVPWHSVDTGFGTYTATALEGEGDAVAFPAVIALLLLIAIVGVVLVRAFAPQVKLPELPIPWNQAIFFATIAVPALLVLKLLFYFDYISFWAYVMILIGGGLAYGGFLISKEPEPESAAADYYGGPGAPPPPGGYPPPPGGPTPPPPPGGSAF
jgi:hypothetical protein